MSIDSHWVGLDMAFFWTAVTYLYNSLLVIFIAVHLIVGACLSFAVGIYVGIYLSQNYNIPRIDEPYRLWERFLTFIEKYRKPNISEVLADDKST